MQFFRTKSSYHPQAAGSTTINPRSASCRLQAPTAPRQLPVAVVQGYRTVWQPRESEARNWERRMGSRTERSKPQNFLGGRTLKFSRFVTFVCHLKICGLHVRGCFGHLMRAALIIPATCCARAGGGGGSLPNRGNF